jgi:hypothetical protein
MIFFIFRSSKIRVSPTNIVSSFFLPGDASPPVDIGIPPRRVTLLFYRAKISSLPLLHLPTMLCPVASPLELKLKH